MRSTPGGRGRSETAEKAAPAKVSLRVIEAVTKHGGACLARILCARVPSGRIAGVVSCRQHMLCSAAIMPAQHASARPRCIAQQAWQGAGVNPTATAKSIASTAARRMALF